MRARVTPLLERLGADFAPDTLVDNLSIAERRWWRSPRRSRSTPA